MILSATFAIKKVAEGSKNVFAFVLLSFTVLLGIAYVGKAFTEAFRKEVVLPNRTIHHVNEYAFQTNLYLQYLSALQGWIFGIRYLKSAAASSLKVSWLTENKVTAIGWIIGVPFIVCVTACYVVILTTFPGWYD